MKIVLSPFKNDKPASDASIFEIGRCLCGTNWYSYCIREWRNGAKGSIVDFCEITDDVYNKGYTLFQKEEVRHLVYHDILQFVSSEIDLARESERDPYLLDLEKQCPIVAEGIIARFVKIDTTHRDYPAMFEAYYAMEKTNYAIERKMRDQYTFNVNLEDEFANGEHLRREQQKIEFSLQHLLPYIRESQHETIRKTADAYIAFVKSKATKTIEFQAKDNRRRNRIASKKEKMNYSRYSLKLNVTSKKLEDLYLMLSKRDDTGKRFIDGDMQIFNEATKCLPLDKDDIKRYKPVDIDKMLFNQVFAGKETDVRIVWRGDAVELWYFIYTLYNYMVNGKRLLDKSGSGPGIWQIVRSRFLNGKARKVFDERIGIEVETDEPIEFGKDAFRKYSQKNTLSNPSVLDAIINKIAPPRDKSDKEVIEEDLNPHKYGIKPPSSPEQLGEDLRDTSHKSKY